MGKLTHINLHFSNSATTAGHPGDTTQTVTPYGQTGPINEESDRNEVLVFWDLPGCTMNFNRGAYDDLVKLDSLRRNSHLKRKLRRIYVRTPLLDKVLLVNTSAAISEHNSSFMIQIITGDWSSCELL